MRAVLRQVRDVWQRPAVPVLAVLAGCFALASAADARANLVGRGAAGGRARSRPAADVHAGAGSKGEKPALLRAEFVEQGMTECRGCAVMAASRQGERDRQRWGLQGRPQTCSRDWQTCSSGTRARDFPLPRATRTGLDHATRADSPLTGKSHRRVFKRCPDPGRYHRFGCPRGDLNPEIGEISLNLGLNSKTGEKSPDRGVHAAHGSGRAPAGVKRLPTGWPETRVPISRKKG